MAEIIEFKRKQKNFQLNDNDAINGRMNQIEARIDDTNRRLDQMVTVEELENMKAELKAEMIVEMKIQMRKMLKEVLIKSAIIGAIFYSATTVAIRMFT